MTQIYGEGLELKAPFLGVWREEKITAQKVIYIIRFCVHPEYWKSSVFLKDKYGDTR